MSASISQSLFVAPPPAPKSGSADRGSDTKTEGSGFADALDEAVAADATESTGTDTGAETTPPDSAPRQAATDERASTSVTDAASPTPAETPTAGLPDAVATLVPEALATPLAVSAAPAAEADVRADTTASGWPPPGLSSLFPEGPLFANAPSASVTVGGITAGTLAAAAGRGPVLSMQPETLPLAPLPAEPLGPGRATGPLPATAALAQPSIAALPDAAIATALARQPAALLLPNLDDEARALGAVGDAAAFERSADGLSPVGFGPLTGSAASGSRLDLSQAFPAPVPMPSPKFAEDLGARLQWMADQQGGDATLRIAPEGLGPVEIRLRLDGDRVELGFLAAQQDTRQALQDALPKLREMLAQQGLQLGQADVGQRQSSGAEADGSERRTGMNGDEADEARGISATTIEPQRVVMGAGRGMLDLYA